MTPYKLQMSGLQYRNASLVSSLNDISTFLVYLMPKPFLYKDSSSTSQFIAIE